MNRYFPIGSKTSLAVEAHIITSEEGVLMVQAAHQAASSELASWNHSDFLDPICEELRKNPGHAGFRIARAHNGNHPTVVIFSIDQFGVPIVGSGIIAIENGQTCPPEC